MPSRKWKKGGTFHLTVYIEFNFLFFRVVGTRAKKKNVASFYGEQSFFFFILSLFSFFPFSNFMISIVTKKRVNFSSARRDENRTIKVCFLFVLALQLIEAVATWNNYETRLVRWWKGKRQKDRENMREKEEHEEKRERERRTRRYSVHEKYSRRGKTRRWRPRRPRDPESWTGQLATRYSCEFTSFFILLRYVASCCYVFFVASVSEVAISVFFFLYSSIILKDDVSLTRCSFNCNRKRRNIRNEY